MKPVNIIVLALAIPSLGLLSSCAYEHSPSGRRAARAQPQSQPQAQEFEHSEAERDEMQRQQARAPIEPPPSEAHIQAQLQEGCPMLVSGTEVDAVDTGKGVALTFTTREGDVSQLRERVRYMADMYQAHAAADVMGWHHMNNDGQLHKHGDPAGADGGTAAKHSDGMPPIQATVTDIENGARIEFTPADSGQLEMLRKEARLHAQRMDAGECWIAQR